MSRSRIWPISSSAATLRKEKENVALRLTERVTRDAHTVDDQLWSALRQHYDDGEIVELLRAIGLFQLFQPIQ
jgi:alkylhydroperoxidase family enzyme